MKKDKNNLHTMTLTFEREQDCPKEVVMWNYYDHEHLLGTHYKLYRGARVLAERDDWALVYRRSKVPIVPFHNQGIGFQFMEGNVMKTFHLDSVGFLLEMEVHFFDLPNNRSKMKIIYNIRVAKWMAFLELPFKMVFTSWFKGAWAEDVPMRNRRWKVHQLGFKDFHGVDYINKKTTKPENFDAGPYIFEPPVPSLPSIRSVEGITRPFSDRTELETSDYSVEAARLELRNL